MLQNTFDFLPTDFNGVKNVILSAKSKNFRLDETPTYVFKCIFDIVARILSSLFNKFISNGIFPDCLKISIVVPIHKSGRKTKVKKYRTISTLPFIGDMFQRLTHSRLSSFLDIYEFLYENQYSFL